MDSSQTPKPVNVNVTAHDSSNVKVVGQIITDKLYLNGEPAEELLNRIDRSGQEPRAGIVHGGDAPVALSYYQPRPAPMQQLQDWIAAESITLIGIEGIGGTGKSTLAARLYQEETATLPRQRYWGDCSQGGTFTELGRKLLLAFGFSPPEQEQQMVAAVVQGLRQRSSLVILDNLESLLDEGGQWRSEDYGRFFVEWQSSGGNSTILLTTRERPPWKGWLGLEWLSLGGFTPAEGVAFLQQLGIGGDLQPFVELVGGHPLLLRLVATLLREEFPQNPHLAQLEHLGLGNLQTLLTDPQVMGPHRRETVGLALVLDASFQRLTAAHQSLLKALCALGGAFDAATALALAEPPCSLDTRQMTQTLRHLQQQSWLERDNSPQQRFDFQPVVQEYLRHKADNLDSAHQRAIAHYSATLTPAPWHTLADLDNHRSLFYHHLQRGDLDSAFDTLRQCDDFLTLQGYYSVMVDLYGQLVAAYPQQGDTQNWKYGASLTDLGNAYYSLGEYGKAIDFHQQSLEILRAMVDRQGEATSLGNLGAAYYSLGEYGKAIEFHQQNLDIARAIGDRRGEANSYGGLGNAYQSLGEYEKAIEFLSQTLDIARAIGNRQGEAASLGNLGNAYYSLGEYGKAIDFHQQSLEIERAIGNRRGEASSLGSLGNAYFSLGEYGKAIEFHQQQLEIARAIGDRSGEANSLGNLGLAYDSLGEYGKAIDFHQQSLEIKRAIGDRQGEANSYGGLGNAYKSLGEYEKAIDFHQKWLDIARAIGNRRGEASSLGSLGNAYDSLGEYGKAIDFHQQHLDIARAIGDRQGEANSLGNLGNAYYSLGEYGKAIDFLSQTLDIARAIGDRRGEANAWFNLGFALSKSDRKEEALVAFRNARELDTSTGLQSRAEESESKIQELTEQASPGRRSKPNVFQRIWRWFRQWVRWVFR